MEAVNATALFTRDMAHRFDRRVRQADQQYGRMSLFAASRKDVDK
jgi:hypothetical protein